jgi:hypothetical protein
MRSMARNSGETKKPVRWCRTGQRAAMSARATVARTQAPWRRPSGGGRDDDAHDAARRGQFACGKGSASRRRGQRAGGRDGCLRPGALACRREWFATGAAGEMGDGPARSNRCQCPRTSPVPVRSYRRSVHAVPHRASPGGSGSVRYLNRGRLPVRFPLFRCEFPRETHPPAMRPACNSRIYRR